MQARLRLVAAARINLLHHHHTYDEASVELQEARKAEEWADALARADYTITCQTHSPIVEYIIYSICIVLVYSSVGIV